MANVASQYEARKVVGYWQASMPNAYRGRIEQFPVYERKTNAGSLRNMGEVREMKNER